MRPDIIENICFSQRYIFEIPFVRYERHFLNPLLNLALFTTDFLFQRIWSDQKTMLLSGFPSGLTEAGAEIALDLDSSSSYGQGSYL